MKLQVTKIEFNIIYILKKLEYHKVIAKLPHFDNQFVTLNKSCKV